MPIPNGSNVAPKSFPCFPHPFLYWIGLHDLEGSPEAEEQRACTKLPTHLLWSQSWAPGCDLSTQSTCCTTSSGRVEGWVLMRAASVGHWYHAWASGCITSMAPVSVGKAVTKADRFTVYLSGLSSLLCSEQQPLLLLFLFPWEQTQGKRLVKEQASAWWAGCLWDRH